MNNGYVGLYEIIQKWADETPDKEAAVIEGERITYKELREISERIAGCLFSAGIRRGDRVGILFPNSITWYSCFWAILRLGAVAVPFGPQLGLYEMRELFSRTGIRVCFITPEFRGTNHLKMVRENMKSFYDLKLVVVDGPQEEERGIISFPSFLRKYNCQPLNYTPCLLPSDPMMLVCTSGTTGKPKIILVEHEGFLQSTRDMADYLNLNSDEIMLLGMPLYHQGGFGMGLQSLVKGGKVIFQEQFTPKEFLKLIGMERVSVVQLSATLAKILISDPLFTDYDLSTLKMAYFAGETLPDGIAEIFYSKLGVNVINILGSSEAASMLVWDSRTDKNFPVNDLKNLPFTDSMVLNDQGQKCVAGEIGIIQVFTDAVLREYYRNETESRQRIKIHGGRRWFNTGDLGICQLNGRIRFSGRQKRIIKRGSNLIYPEEIESCLLTHPHILAVAVVGEENAIFGEKTIAYIEVKERAIINHGSLLKFCKGKLSAYKIPDKFLIVPEIPKNIGKIQYKIIRERRHNFDRLD